MTSTHPNWAVDTMGKCLHMYTTAAVWSADTMVCEEHRVQQLWHSLAMAFLSYTSQLFKISFYRIFRVGFLVAMSLRWKTDQEEVFKTLHVRSCLVWLTQCMLCGQATRILKLPHCKFAHVMCKWKEKFVEDWLGGLVSCRGRFLDYKAWQELLLTVERHCVFFGAPCHSPDMMWAAVELAAELNFGKVEEDGKKDGFCVLLCVCVCCMYE